MSLHKLRAIFVLLVGDFPEILQRTFRFIRYLLFFPSNSRTGCLDTKRRTWDAGKSFFELHFCAGSHRLLSFITSKKSSPTRHCQTEWQNTEWQKKQQQKNRMTETEEFPLITAKQNDTEWQTNKQNDKKLLTAKQNGRTQNDKQTNKQINKQKQKSSPTRHCQTEWHTTRKAKASMSCWESEQKPGWQK